MRILSASVACLGLSLVSLPAAADSPFPRTGSAKLAAYTVCRSLGIIDMGTVGSQSSADCVGIIKSKEAAKTLDNFAIHCLEESRARADFSDPYYRPVARFAVRRDARIDDVRPEQIEGKTIAVVAGTAHEQYLRTLFTEAEVKPYRSAEAAREALRRGETDLLFGDGFALSFWLNGTGSGNCCHFVGGPFLESRYFGEGVGVGVKRGNDTLRLAINWALFRLWEKGRFTDLWLRYFPINPY